MQKNFYITIFLLFLAINNLNATTLNEAINLLYENNNKLKSEKMKVKSAKAAFASTIFNVAPDVRFQKTLHQRNDWIKLDGTVITSKNLNHDKTVLTLRDTLSFGDIILDPLRGSKNLDIQKLTYRVNEQNIILQAISTYLNVIKTEEMLRATKENEEILKKYTELIKRRLEFGEVTKTDLEQSKSRYYTMQSNRIQADGNYKVSKALYKKIFGIDPKQLSIPKNYPKIPKTFDELKKLAQEGNLDLQISKLTTVVAKYDITRATNKLLPSVSFSYNRLRGDENLQLNGFKEQKTYEIGLNVPIFPNGGSEYTNIMQAKYNFNKTYYDYEDYKLDLERQIVATWNDVKTYNANVEASKIALEFTTITLDAVKREAQYGSRTTLDVLNAELDNFNASVNLIQARYSQVLSYYNLLALIGTLNQKIFNNEIAG